MRRIEALTGPEALAWMQEQRRHLQAAARALKASAEEVPARIEALQAQLKEAKKKGAQTAAAGAGNALDRLRSALRERDGMQLGALDLPELDQAGIRDLADRARGALKDAAFVLLGRQGDKVPFLAASEGKALASGFQANELAALVREHLGGGGGGKPNVAQGAGADASKVPQALEALERRFAATP